jgi:hypothetical protein
VDIKSNKAKFDDCAMDNFDPGNTESIRIKINIDKLTPDKCFQKSLQRNDKPISANQNKVLAVINPLIDNR